MKSIPYWLDTAAPFEEAERGPAEGQVDVAVIGGGLTGLAAALSLARKGASVALLERERVGGGASGRNGGMCTTALAIGYRDAVARYGVETATRYFMSYCDAIDTVERLVGEEGIDCHFARSGKLNLAAKPAHYEGLARTHEALAEVGYETRLIPREALGAELASERYFGGMADPRGAGLHVGKFSQGLARAAHRAGARICEGTSVTGLKRLGGQRHEISVSAKARNGAGRSSLVADQVLLATGSTTGAAFPDYRRRIVPVGSFIVVTEPLGAERARQLMPTRRMASDSRHLLYYFRITPDERLLFGGRAQFALSTPDAERSSGRILERGMVEVFPQLAGTRVDYCWGGLVDMTLDRMPRAGERDGLFYSMGYSGHGVQMSTHMGTRMAEVMDGKPEANPWRDLDWPGIPGYSGRPWFLPLVGAYYRFLDLVR